MRVEILDVGHGSAALVIADNNNLLLLDCGHDDKGFRPSSYLPQRWRAVQQFIVSHYDSDHVSDLAALQVGMPIERMLSNPTISVEEIRRLKLQEGPLKPGMAALLKMKSNFVPLAAGIGNEADLAGIAVYYFYNSYLRFQDMNNLSLVAFIKYDDFSIVFPGDIERAGWLVMLERADFRELLAQVNVFVASHHGRENGYCEEMFQHCRPDIVIISDKNVEHNTQEHCYDTHASGIDFWRGIEYLGRRYALTTRKDGHIVIEKTRGNPFTISIG